MVTMLSNKLIANIIHFAVNVLNAFRSRSAEIAQMNEGDPCVPTPWEWINCSATTLPRITKM